MRASQRDWLARKENEMKASKLPGRSEFSLAYDLGLAHAKYSSQAITTSEFNTIVEQHYVNETNFAGLVIACLQGFAAQLSEPRLC